MPLRNSFEMHDHIAQLMGEQGFTHDDFVMIGEPVLSNDYQAVIAGFEAVTEQLNRYLFVYSQWHQGRSAAVARYSVDQVIEIGGCDYELGRDRILRAYAFEKPFAHFLHETYISSLNRKT